MADLKPRTIKLHCPSTSEVTVMAVWEEERVDLGSIAIAFGLKPKTVKLNAHFISTDADFVASSVTWKSLLSFFASKGLSANEIVVHGKLATLGFKRACEALDSANGTFFINRGKSSMEDSQLLKKTKLRNGDSDLRLLKRLRIDETGTGRMAKGDNGEASKIVSSTGVRCTPGRDPKRLREDSGDEAVFATQCKRVR